MKKRKSLTPATGIPAEALGVHNMRRSGPRREVSERVQLVRCKDKSAMEGWALNISRGGIRAILEEALELGEELELTVGDEDQSQLCRRGRVVWIQEESDGAVVGIEFVSTSGTHRSAPPAAPESKPE